MNLHPIVVHFPIALWIIYCLILIVQLFWGKDNIQLNTVKQFCLIAGTVGGSISLQTGEGAEHLLGRSNLVEMHATLANISQYVFGVFAVATIYSLQSWTKKYTQDSRLRAIINKIINYKAMAIVGVIGLILLTLVGALGGAISRGTGTGDPVSDWAVKTLVGEVATQTPNKNNDTNDDTTDITITPPADSATTSYTMTQIAEHKDEASCRSAINGIVYDLSAFISKHPGGDRNILRICGIDGSSAFNGKHGGQMKPEQTLAGFEIGILAK